MNQFPLLQFCAAQIFLKEFPRDLKDLNSFILTASLGSGNIVPWSTLEQTLKMLMECVSAIMAPVECSEPGLW